MSWASQIWEPCVYEMLVMGMIWLTQIQCVCTHSSRVTQEFKVQVQIERTPPHLQGPLLFHQKCWRCSPVLCRLESSSRSSRKFDAFSFLFKENQSMRKGERSPALLFTSHSFRTWLFSSAKKRKAGLLLPSIPGHAGMGHTFKSRRQISRSYFPDWLRARKRSLETWFQTCFSLTLMSCITLGQSLTALIVFIYEIKYWWQRVWDSIYKQIRLNTYSQKPPVKRQEDLKVWAALGHLS